MRVKAFLLPLFTICLALCTTTLNAAIQEVTYSKASVAAKRYEVIDIKFKTSSNIATPFEREFSAMFTSPSGVKQRVLGFYNGGKEWVIRFSAEEAGEWSYTTTSEIKQLNAKSGRVQINKAAYMQRKGTVRPDKNDPQHMVWSDGSPYFMLGFECDFLFALDYHRPTTARMESFLDRVAENGFNHIVMNVYANDVVWEKDPKLDPEYELGNDEKIFPFLGSNSNPDHSSLNVEFFKKLDRAMEALNDRNLISHLMIYVWNKAVAWPKVGSAEDDRYFNYVAKRYQAFPNLVWDISKEAILYGTIDDNYVTKRIHELRELDSYDRVITVHDIGYCIRNAEMVDMASSQNWKLLINNEMLNSRMRKNTTKPLLSVEHGGYEECDYEVFCGNYINAEYCLRRNYECLFAGTYTTYYWQGCSWNVLIDDYDTSSKVSYRPRMEYFKHMSDLFTKYPFHTFKPDPANSNSGFCMANGEGTYLIYMPKESYKTSMGKIMKLAKKLSFQWFNVHTGEYRAATVCDQMNIFANEPHPWHMEHDAVLIVKIIEPKEQK